MSLERLRRQHNLETKPSMTFLEARTDKDGKRYTFRLNNDAIFYAIPAADFWAGSKPAPAPEPARVRPRPQIRVPRGEPQPATLELIRADELRSGDVIARKASPAGRMTVHHAEPAAVYGKTRLTYTNSRGRRSSDAFSGEKFILYTRTK